MCEVHVFSFTHIFYLFYFSGNSYLPMKNWMPLNDQNGLFKESLDLFISTFTVKNYHITPCT